MNIGPYRFDSLEFSGSLGDLGTLVPLSIALMVIVGLSPTAVLLMVGLFYMGSGLYFRLPIPVQPLKVVSAIAIAAPTLVTVPIMAATGMIFGGFLVLLSVTGLVDWLARFFTKPIIRGIQVGLGLILLAKGIEFMGMPNLLIGSTETIVSFGSFSLNMIVGIFGFLLVLALISSKKFPAALVIVFLGIILGLAAGGMKNIAFTLGPSDMQLYAPSMNEFFLATILLVIPQIPLTLGNAVMATADTAKDLFGKDGGAKATYRSTSMSMGLANLGAGFIGGMPMCHGAGGLAAHYRFGARTGGSNLMIGFIFVIIAVLLGEMAVGILGSIPNAVLGILLFFAGLELVLLIRDVREKIDFFIVFSIAGIGLATTNMSLAFIAGIVIQQVIRMGRIEI